MNPTAFELVRSHAHHSPLAGSNPVPCASHGEEDSKLLEEEEERLGSWEPQKGTNFIRLYYN